MTKQPKAEASTQPKRDPGVGFDIGTSFLVSAHQEGSKLVTKSLRDCYITLRKADISRDLLSDLNDVLYIESDDKLIVLADKAWKLSGSLGSLNTKSQVTGNDTGVLKTPLHRGLINPDDQEAYSILKTMVHSMLGDPVTLNEVAYFSVPAAPLDQEEQDEIYHRSLLEDIFASIGYDPRPMNEAHAIAFSECKDEDFSGLCISYGHGMTNFCLTLDTVEALSFSVARGGSWIDQGAARSVRANPVFIQSLKEGKDLDLMKSVTTSSREERAIQAYYKDLIKYSIEAFKTQFSTVANKIFLDKPISLVVSGGTSMPKGFLEIFKHCLGDISKFPIPLKEVRVASDPLKAVAKGLLIKARSET